MINEKTEANCLQKCNFSQWKIDIFPFKENTTFYYFKNKLLNKKT